MGIVYSPIYLSPDSLATTFVEKPNTIESAVPDNKILLIFTIYSLPFADEIKWVISSMLAKCPLAPICIIFSAAAALANSIAGARL